MKARTTIVILAVTVSVILLAQRGRTDASIGTEFGADLPVGSIVVYAGSTAPQGWLMCDGQLYGVLTYPELFDVLEFTYGSNIQKDAFRVPDLTGRVPVGQKPFTWYCDVLGDTGGEAEVSLMESEMPSHRHDVSASSHSHDISVSPHNHDVTVWPHSHDISDPKHSHGTTDPGHNHNITDPGHTHRLDLHDEGGLGYVDDSGNDYRGFDETRSSTTGILIHNAKTHIVLDSAATGIRVQSVTTCVSLSSTTDGASAQSANVKILEESKGSGAAHQNLQPYIVLHYIIKY